MMRSMASALVAAAAYAVSSLTIIFANTFVMHVLRDPFVLLLSQVAVTLSFSLVAICFFKRSEFNAFFNIRNAGWFAIIGFSSFVGWTASLEGLKSGSVATLTMIKAVNPFLAAVFAHIFSPLPKPNHISRRLTWMVLAGAGCSFYAHDRASTDVRACFFFFITMLSASINTVYLKHMQVSSLLPEDALLSVLYCSALINAAAMPFVLAAFFNTVSSDVAVQIATLLCAPISLIALVLSLCSSIAISLSGFWAQRLLSPTAYIVLINSCKIPAVIISMLLDILLQFLKLLNALSAKKKCAIALTFVCIFALAQGFIGIAKVTTITSTRSYYPSHLSLSSLQRLYESAAGPDPRILTGLPVDPRRSHHGLCIGSIPFEQPDLTHSLFDAAVKFSPGFEFVLGISNYTLQSWRNCSLNALRDAREYYARTGGGVLPETISAHPYHVCPELHRVVAPVILGAINSLTYIFSVFGQHVPIKSRYCFEATGRPPVNPSQKLTEWRTFLKDKVDKVAPVKYSARKRGYVFAGSSRKNLIMARSIVDVLRSFGSTLPAEFWIDPVDEGSPQISSDECQRALVLSGLECRYMCEISEIALYFPLCHPTWGYSPYQSKLIAIKYSSFEQVFFLDNDVVPLKSMDFMFFTQQFLKYGAIFWAEALPAQPGFPWGPDVADSIGVNWSHPVQDEYKQYLSPLCSAQIMIDKGKFWRELSLATYLNLDTTFYYRVLHGDKDIFAAAWMALGSRWYLIQASGIVGYACKMREGKCAASLQYSGPDTRVCGTEWLRYDTEGQPLLVHHTKDMDSMTVFDSGKVDTSWQLIVEYTNMLNPVSVGIAGGGYSTKMEVEDKSKQRSLSSGWHCLEFEAKKNVVVKNASTTLGNVQWLFYQVVNWNFGKPLHMPLDSMKCLHAPNHAGLVLIDKETQYRHYYGLSSDNVRPKFLGVHAPCLCLFVVGKMSDPKTLCLDRPMRPGCVVYDIGVENDRLFASSMRQLGCEVHSNDPTMRRVTAEDWFQGSGGRVLHSVGVVSTKFFVEGLGNMQTVASIMKENAHNVIDFLKIDVESFEWDTLLEMHSSGVLERVGAIQMQVHFWNKACFAHLVEWETLWAPRGYPSEASSSRACTNENAAGSAASKEDLVFWQRSLDVLQDSGFQQVSLRDAGGGHMVEFPGGEVLPCCYEINLLRPGWDGTALNTSRY